MRKSKLPNPCKLTRFLRGYPSSTPDSRMPADVDIESQEDEIEFVEEVGDEEAVHVCIMTGKLVLFMGKWDLIAAYNYLTDLLEAVSERCHVPAKQLKIVHNDEVLETTEVIERLLGGTSGVVELMLLIEEKKLDLHEQVNEVMLENGPGEEVDLIHLARIL